MRFQSIPKRCVPLDHPALTSVATEVPDEQAPAHLLHLAKGLKMALKRSDTGIGIALPQLGVSLRGFHIAAKVAYPRKARFCFNPSWEDVGQGTVTHNEGCLSIEEGKALFPVTRARTIKVTYTNEKGREVIEELSGLAARVFQHEYDHLDGVLITAKPAPTTYSVINESTTLHHV
jgi:peptide deformylase